MHPPARLLFVAIALCSVVPACTSGDDGASTDEADWRSKPTGPDQTGGSLVVLAPPVAAGATLAPSKVTMLSAQATADLGVAVGGLRVGRHTFSVASHGADGLSSSFSASVAIAAGGNVQVQLGGVRINRKGMPVTLGVSTSALIGGDQTQASATAMTPNDARLAVGVNADGTSIVAAAPGEYSLLWGFGDGIVVPVTANATTSLDAWDYAQRRVGRLVPSLRELPDACNESYSMSLMNGKGTSFAFRDQEIELGLNDVLHQRLYGQPAASMIDIHFPCVVKPYALQLGAKGAGPKVAKVGRLDVDDVEVTMADGSKKRVNGTYWVLDAQGQNVLRSSYPTNTGVDLPPGTYKLHVDYPQSAGTTGSYEETFTVP